MAVLQKPRIEVYIGQSGSGKGVSITRRLAELKPARLLVWDPRNEYKTEARKVTIAEAVRLVAAAGSSGGFRLRVVNDATTPIEEAFALVCKLAFRAGNLVFLAEELSDVTRPSWAPPAWKQCITQGRHQALHVIGVAQRPALMDKNILGNCTYVRVFSLRYLEDRKAMAAAMDVPLADVSALETIETPTHTVINYLERDFRAKVLQKGQIKLRARS
jgi:hypothetical protein